MCKDIVTSPEICAKLTFPVSLKQPGPRDGVIQCFIKRDKSKLTYRLYLCLSSAVLDENGKFLLAAKRSRRTTHTDYAISMDSKNLSRSSTGYIGKLRSNFLGTKFIIYDTLPPFNAGRLCSQERPPSRRFSSRKVSPKVPVGSYPMGQVNYELNVLGTRGPRRMLCTMHSIPESAVEAGGVVPGQPKELLPRLFDESLGSTASSLSKYSIADSSMDLSSCRYSECGGGGDDADKERERPLVLRNKAPRWHEQLQCWCLNFRGRVTVASVKNFQLIASPASAGASAQPQAASGPSSHDTVILQFGKVARDMFTMDYRYPLSAFQAFAICLTSFDTKLACE